MKNILNTFPSYLVPSKVLFFVGLIGAIGCSQKSSSPTPSPSTPASSNSEVSLACTSVVIDQGQKGSVATVARGAYSDTKMIPNSAWPATAYGDTAALSLKLSYWTGSNFVTETISGDGGATFVRLVFLSNGTPIVIWTLGVNVKAAIRSAPLTASGTWQSGVVDTGIAPRALEISVNPLDQVAVTFLTDTATTGRAKFLYCDAPCVSTAGFQTMGSNPFIENTNLVTAQVASGSAWCKVSNSVYYPVATYSVVGSTKYAICTNTLANCLNGANWITTPVIGTASQASKIYLDPSIAGDVPKVVISGGSGITPYRMGTTSCSSAFAAFSAGTAIGTATSGSQWLTVLKDSNSRFHLVANEGTTGVKYYNTVATDIIGSWNTAGALDTVTLPAAHSGGATLSPLSPVLYASYGTNAVPYDVKFGYVNDLTVASNGATFTRVVADETGDLQLAAAGSQTRQIASASTSAGRPAVAYVDFSNGSVAGAKLKFAARSGDTAKSAWEITILPSAINPQNPSLHFDANDLPWISYFDASTVRFYLATNSRSDGSGGWYTYEFPTVPSGAPIALPAANNTSLALYPHARQTDIVMAAIDNNATSKGVRVSIFNTVTRAFGASALVDPLTGGAAGAANVSLDSDTSGNLAIVYQDLSVGRIKYASSVNGATTWTTPASVSGVAQGAGAQLKINPSTQSPAISYFDQANNTVYYASCLGTIASCSSGGWAQSTVDGAAGISTLPVASSQMLTTSLRFQGGNPYISYVRGQGNDGNVMVSTPTNGVFQPTVAARGTSGALAGSPALNFGVAGWQTQITNNAVGSIIGVYLGPGNWLYSFSCGD